MKLKSFIVAFGSLVLTTTLLYLIGYIFSIPLLMFQYEYKDSVNGFFISTGSLIPIMIGLVISFVSEKVYLYKHQKNLVNNGKFFILIICYSDEICLLEKRRP